MLCKQLLGMLEKEHHAYVRKEGLNIENEPEKSYLKSFSDRVSRAVERKRAKFVQVVQPRNLLREALRDCAVREAEEAQQADHSQAQQHGIRVASDDLDLMETMSNASGKWSSTSRTSQGPAFLHKIKYKQGKIKAKAMAVESVLKQPDILTNAKLLGKAGAAWGQAELHRTEYTAILEEAFENMGEDERLIQAIAGDEERETWLMGIEADLDEKLMLRTSPEKEVNKTEEHLKIPQNWNSQPSIQDSTQQ